ncbi:UNVERIFIED_CONTAM: hypothetical protein FKN15_029842 [Acipenser sinensis]
MRKRQLPASFWEEPRSANSLEKHEPFHSAWKKKQVISDAGLSAHRSEDQKRKKRSEVLKPHSALAIQQSVAEKEPVTLEMASLTSRMNLCGCCPFQYHGQHVYQSHIVLPQSGFSDVGLWGKASTSPTEEPVNPEQDLKNERNRARQDQVPMRKRQLPASFWEEPRSANSLEKHEPFHSAWKKKQVISDAGLSAHRSEDQKRKKRSEVLKSHSALAIQQSVAEKEPVTLEMASLTSRMNLCGCCPFQYHGQHVYQSHIVLPQSGFSDVGLWGKASTSPTAAHIFSKDPIIGQKGHAHVVLKPIPTKPSVPSPIFSVFGFV